MPIAPKASVRVNLALAILVTIVLSWILSGALANYVNYLNIKSYRQQMLHQPDRFGRMIPEPKFGVSEFLFGRPPLPRGPMGNDHHPGMPGPHGPRDPFERPFFDAFLQSILPRLAVAFALAATAGILLGRRFTKPLMQLAKGADQFHAGHFDYRIPCNGNDEFTAVATSMNDMARQVSGHIDQLEQDAERRRQFLADIAHELRSPVTTMRTMAGALKDGLADEPDRRKLAEAALVRTSERLLRLVQDLMELAKLDLNELPLNVRTMDLQELAASAVQSHQEEAASAGILLHPLERSEPVMFPVDPDRMTQVIDNILQNAISYAGRGAEVKTTVSGGEKAVIRIADTGRGISAMDMPYIFDSFYRADAARTPGEAHSGLGLRIARRLVEIHGGTLEISSTEGSGTTVDITFPLSKQA
jgi:two-component system sensor histidine kinase BaeS